VRMRTPQPAYLDPFPPTAPGRARLREEPEDEEEDDDDNEDEDDEDEDAGNSDGYSE
jgi:hypothetical protein